MKEELSVDKLKGVKLWITAGPREMFTESEVMYEDMMSFVSLKCAYFMLFLSNVVKLNTQAR